METSQYVLVFALDTWNGRNIQLKLMNTFFEQMYITGFWHTTTVAVVFKVLNFQPCFCTFLSFSLSYENIYGTDIYFAHCSVACDLFLHNLITLVVLFPIANI